MIRIISCSPPFDSSKPVAFAPVFALAPCKYYILARFLIEIARPEMNASVDVEMDGSVRIHDDDPLKSLMADGGLSDSFALIIVLFSFSLLCVAVFPFEFNPP